MYASAQDLDFLARTKNPSFPNRNLAGRGICLGVSGWTLALAAGFRKGPQDPHVFFIFYGDSLDENGAISVPIASFIRVHAPQPKWICVHYKTLHYAPHPTRSLFSFSVAKLRATLSAGLYLCARRQCESMQP